MRVQVRPPKAANDEHPSPVRIRLHGAQHDDFSEAARERLAAALLAQKSLPSTAELTGLLVFIRIRRVLLSFARVGAKPPKQSKYDPFGSELLLRLFCGPEEREGILQDLTEFFERDLLAGRRQWQAKALYWAGVGRSVLPLAWAAARRLTWFGTLVAAFKRLVS